MQKIEVFYGSLASSAGRIFKSLQVVDVPTLEETKAEVNGFISRPDIEVITIQHQFNDGIMSILVYYMQK